MREIRGYRGMRTDNGEWVYGDLIHGVKDQKGLAWIWQEEEDGIGVNEYQVIPETVGQDTGMKDKNGKSVFDGDIVKTRDDVYFCVWDEYNYEYMFRNEKEDFGIAYVSSEDIEIIGTVYKNPELLGGK